MTDQKTLWRQAILTSSGYESSSDAGDAFLTFITDVGSQKQERDRLSEEQKLGIKRTLHNVPQTYDVLRDIIAQLEWPEEQRENLHLCLVMLMDDLFSLGSVAMLDGSNSLSVFHEAQAEVARAQNIVQAQARHSSLKEAILEETKGVDLVDSDKFAGSIEDGVRERLNVTTDRGYSRTSIRRQIRAILKDRDKH